MALTLEMLKNLICSQCQLYLSAFPVKVYSNRQVKCARCTQENDGGTISRLYYKVAQHVKFPCKYHYEGCKQLLSPYETMEHEKSCSKTIESISCSCDLSEFSLVFLFLSHVKTNHSERLLEHPEFYVNLDEIKGRTEMFDYIYCENNCVVFIKYDYNKEREELVLSTKHFRGEKLEIVRYKVLLYSIDNKVKMRTRTYNMHSSLNKVSIFIRPQLFTKGVLICKIILDNHLELILKENNIIQYSEEFERAHFKYTFEGGLINLKNDQQMCSPIYYICSIPWRIYIKKIQHEKTYMGIFLESNGKFPRELVATIGITLLSCDKNKNKDIVLGDCDFRKSRNWGFSNFIEWIDLCSPANGFIHNDSITVKAEIRYVEINENEKETLPATSSLHVCQKLKFTK